MNSSKVELQFERFKFIDIYRTWQFSDFIDGIYILLPIFLFGTAVNIFQVNYICTVWGIEIEPFHVNSQRAPLLAIWLREGMNIEYYFKSIAVIIIKNIIF